MENGAGWRNDVMIGRRRKRKEERKGGWLR
jgi:hypothetical protein